MATTEGKRKEITVGIEITFAADGKVLVEKHFRQHYGDERIATGPYYESGLFEGKEEALAHISEIWGE